MGQQIIERASFAGTALKSRKGSAQRQPKAIDFQITIENSHWYRDRKTSPFSEGRVYLFYENKRGNGFNIFP